MSSKGLIIEERSRDIGDFIVGRLLPFRKKRMVGPFIFVDHMGPTNLGLDSLMEVDQHPHIGLATLTYLLKGEVMHADSIGTVQRITPGEVNLMIAGKAVTHTERTPEDLIGTEYEIEGYQIWIALPKEMEDMEPEFHHLSSQEVIEWKQGGLNYKLVAGSAFGKQSSLELWSDAFMVEISSDMDADIDLSGMFNGELGILVNQGSIQACSETIEKGNLLITKDIDICKFSVTKSSRIFLIGGSELPEKRYIDWNFVSSDKEKIERAKSKWKAGEFPKVPNDESYVAYPKPKS